jgi:radical SAM superfamily enzyme YgiQ (UPF0313 family)
MTNISTNNAGKKVLFIEPPPTIDWTPESRISKAGRRHPCLNETGEQVYSYQNLSCAAVLRQMGFDVSYLHCPTMRLSVNETCLRFDSISPYALVIMVEHINSNVAEFISAHAKKNGCAVIWAGPHVTALHKSEITKDCVDFILRREWDYSVAELVQALINKNPLEKIEGLTWKRPDGTVVVNEDRAYIEDLDGLPIPAYDLLDLSKFYESVFVAFPAATMITSRGCPYTCMYCSYPQTIYGHRNRTMSPERVVREIEYLVNRMGVKEIRIDDDTFNIDVKRAVGICRLIKEKKIKVLYSVQVRPALMTDELAKWLKKSGCRMVLYGVESGNDGILEKMRKHTTKDEIRRGVKIAKRNKLDVLNCVMLGFYWDTPSSVEETMNFAFELNAEFTQVSTPTPLPGTDYFKLLDENKCLLTKDWHLHDSVHHSAVSLPNLTNGQLNGYLGSFYRRYYRRPRYLFMMTLRMFRSWGNFSQSLRKFSVLFTK